MATLPHGIFSQFYLGPIGQFMGGHDFTERPRMDKLGARHLALLGGAIELPELVGAVPS
jgi:hypothetical protein